MYQRVRTYIRENQMIVSGDIVIAGVSGGGDSMAMLYFLQKYREEVPFTLQVVHVNHQIRGAEALRDSRLVEETCRQWGIPCRICSYPVPELAARWKMGLEEAGRKVRKEAFEEEASRLGRPFPEVKVAIAHNQDDLAETMLHHLARGTGLRGLSCMRPVSRNLVRPVLCLEKQEIVNYLKDKEIPYILDSSNLSDDYTRNRIRHHILPMLQQEVNSCATAHMARTACMAAQAEDYLTRKGTELLEQCMKKTDNSGRMEGYILGQVFGEADPIGKTYALQQALEQLAGRRKDISAVHVEQVLELENRQTGKRISLPYGLYAEKTYEGIYLGKVCKTAFTGSKQEKLEWELPIPGTLTCALGSLQASLFSYQGQKIHEKKCTKWLDYDKIKEIKLSVRTRREGDFLVVNREGSRKKLSRIMIDDKIPSEQRQRIPLVAAGEEILWMIGGRINERYKITPKTEWVLELQYKGDYDYE
jgi:tRNA(Ile)-lysidine synthase